MTEKTYSQHQSEAVKARWAKKTPEERSAYAKMMVEAREAKRKAAGAGKRDPAPQGSSVGRPTKERKANASVENKSSTKRTGRAV